MAFVLFAQTLAPARAETVGSEGWPRIRYHRPTPDTVIFEFCQAEGHCAVIGDRSFSDDELLGPSRIPLQKLSRVLYRDRYLKHANDVADASFAFSLSLVLYNDFVHAGLSEEQFLATAALLTVGAFALFVWPTWARSSLNRIREDQRLLCEAQKMSSTFMPHAARLDPNKLRLALERLARGRFGLCAAALR